jgi:enoyl-CoA hydratase/carnithine racemase
MKRSSRSCWKRLNRIRVSDALLETARSIRDNAPLSIRRAKTSIRNGPRMDLKRGFMFEIEAYNRQVQAGLNFIATPFMQ